MRLKKLADCPAGYKPRSRTIRAYETFAPGLKELYTFGFNLLL